MATRNKRRKRASADQYVDPDMKPVVLDPEVPHYSSDYYGPPPDAGFSYGSYNCSSCDETSLLTKGEEMHCPHCGAMFSEMPEEPETKEQGYIDTAAYAGVCEACYAELHTTDEAFGEGNYCPQCGSAMGGDKPMSDEDMETDEDYTEEYLEDPNDIKEPIMESSISMDLFNTDGKNPHWNLGIAGTPVAKICLQDQKSPEEYRPSFVDASYGQNTALAISKVGLKKVLSSLRARVYAYKILESDLSKSLGSKIQKKEEAKYRKARATLNSNLRTCINVTLAGMNKNFFPDLDNHLKHSLHTRISAMGISNPQNIIEAAFKESADKFFETVLSKAEALLEEEPKVLEALARAITNVNTVVAVEEPSTAAIQEANDNESLASRLERNSLPFSFGGLEESLPENNQKETLKQKLQLDRKSW